MTGRPCPVCGCTARSRYGCTSCSRHRQAMAAFGDAMREANAKACRDCGRAIVSGHWCRECYKQRKAVVKL